MPPTKKPSERIRERAKRWADNAGDEVNPWYMVCSILDELDEQAEYNK